MYLIYLQSNLSSWPPLQYEDLSNMDTSNIETVPIREVFVLERYPY